MKGSNQLLGADTFELEDAISKSRRVEMRLSGVQRPCAESINTRRLMCSVAPDRRGQRCDFGTRLCLGDLAGTRARGQAMLAIAKYGYKRRIQESKDMRWVVGEGGT